MSADFDPEYDEPQTIGEHIKKFIRDVRLAKVIKAELNDQASIEKNLAEIIERCKSRGAVVLLAGMYTTTDEGLDYERQIQDCYQTLAREHDVPLIPFFLEGVAGRDELNQQDRIHPNAEGTKIVAANVYRYLKPMLEKDAQGK